MEGVIRFLLAALASAWACRPGIRRRALAQQQEWLRSAEPALRSTALVLDQHRVRQAEIANVYDVPLWVIDPSVRAPLLVRTRAAFRRAWRRVSRS